MLYFYLRWIMDESGLLAIVARAQAAQQARTQNTNILADCDPLYDLAENSVTKSHALSRAYYRLSLVEKRCMEALISKLNPLRQDNLQDIELLAADYSRAFPDTGKHAYEHLATAVDALLNRVIIIPETNEKVRKMTLTAQAVYEKNAGKITVTFNPLIVSHLIGLREKFSSYPLKKAVNFTSSYTWRFYEILVSWAQDKKITNGRFMGWIENQSVHELRDMLGVPESYNWGMFQRQVLNIVTDELKEKSNIALFIENIKTSRRITHLNIRFIEDSQTELQLEGGESPKKKRGRKPKAA